jgi:hypothetical protein
MEKRSTCATVTPDSVKAAAPRSTIVAVSMSAGEATVFVKVLKLLHRVYTYIIVIASWKRTRQDFLLSNM